MAEVAYLWFSAHGNRHTLCFYHTRTPTKVMKVEQAAVSKLERREDMYVSTLRDYVKALGGELKLVASFPDAEIQVHPFEIAR